MELQHVTRNNLGSLGLIPIDTGGSINNMTKTRENILLTEIE
jgi:hypothetical protein